MDSASLWDMVQTIGRINLLAVLALCYFVYRWSGVMSGALIAKIMLALVVYDACASLDVRTELSLYQLLYILVHQMADSFLGLWGILVVLSIHGYTHRHTALPTQHNEHKSSHEP